MNFSCIGTGSSGNCYLLKVGSSNLLLDAGVKLSKIIKEVNLNKLDFAYISHDHLDHSLSKEKLVSRGVRIIDGKLFDRFQLIEKTPKNLMLWTFPVEHGDCDCNGLIIKSDKECILYVTDFNNCIWDLRLFKFTSIIIECNYITDKAIEGKFKRTKENIQRHLSLDGCYRFLNKLNLTQCEEIILTHFSEDYSDPIFMGSYIHEAFGIKTLACKRHGGYDTYE